MKMEKISAENILFIKLGRGGDFEEKCIKEKTLKLGYSEVDYELCKKGDWKKVQKIFLEKRNIQTRTVFTGNILRQPGFKNIAHKAHTEGYPEADKVMRGGMLMACHHGLNDIQIAHVMESVTEFMKMNG